MSKMREALSDAINSGQKNPHVIKGGAGFSRLVQEIAQRYGDLEFTREEVLKLMEAAGKAPVRDRNDAEIILSRHLGESESGDKEQTDSEKAADAFVSALRGEPHPLPEAERKEVINAVLNDRRLLYGLSERLAAIEKRVLADGHTEECSRLMLVDDYLDNKPKCTCGHDALRESTVAGSEYLASERG